MVLVSLLVGGFATKGQTKEPKHYWQGIPVRMFMDIEGQQFSYVAGFIDSAVLAYHQHGVASFKWMVECLANHPKRTNRVEITKAIIGKLPTILKDLPNVREISVGSFIWAELEVRCGQAK